MGQRIPAKSRLQPVVNHAIALRATQPSVHRTLTPRISFERAVFPRDRLRPRRRRFELVDRSFQRQSSEHTKQPFESSFKSLKTQRCDIATTKRSDRSQHPLHNATKLRREQLARLFDRLKTLSQ